VLVVRFYGTLTLPGCSEKSEVCCNVVNSILGQILASFGKQPIVSSHEKKSGKIAVISALISDSIQRRMAAIVRISGIGILL
jgi:hypothetical protein